MHLSWLPNLRRDLWHLQYLFVLFFITSWKASTLVHDACVHRTDDWPLLAAEVESKLYESTVVRDCRATDTWAPGRAHWLNT